ncbi:rho GTPase-activating protein 23-like [Tachypleus tridentatus]|uniref:rho GTPase-activating protein 23-like n=1 Tax=Tachypleus tridentatus TaxID=6853 RepID=UPI003FCFBAA0
MMVSREQHQKEEVQAPGSGQQDALTEVKPWWPGPRRLVLHRDDTDFGFTLRHFIIYPPDKNQGQEKEEPYIERTAECNHQRREAMDTIFVREVKEGSPAHSAGLVIGDRIVSVNGHPITGKTYPEVIGLIQNSSRSLELLVVPKEEDILQLYFSSSAYQPVERIPPNIPNNQKVVLGMGDHPKAEEKFEKDEFSLKESKDNIENIEKFQHKDSATKLSSVGTQNISHVIRDTGKENDYSHLRVRETASSSAVNISHKPSEVSKDPVNLFDIEGHVNGSFVHSHQQGPPHFVFKKKRELPARVKSNKSDRTAYNCTDSQSLQLTDPVFEQSFIPLTESRNRESKSTMNSLHEKVIDRRMSEGVESHSLLAMGGERTGRPVLSSVHYPMSVQGHPHGGQGSEGILDTLSEPSSPRSTPDGEAQHVSSLHLVAQRRHQFEPSYLLARQLERINLHKSELARMSPHHPIVAVRAAKFQQREVMSDSETSTPSSHYHRALPKPHRMESLKSHPAAWKGFKEFSQKNLSSSLGTPLSSNKEKEQQLTLLDTNDVVKKEDIVDDDKAVFPQPPTSASPPGVVLRKKPPIGEEVPVARRVSYLRATAGERIHVDSDLEYSDEEEDHSLSSEQSTPSSTHRLQKLKAFFGEKTPQILHAIETRPAVDEPVVLQGWLACKALTVEGKRSSDRSWRPVWAVLDAETFYLLKEKRDITEVGAGSEDIQIAVKSSLTGVAHDYTKKKHVFRLRLPGGTEYLLQADTHEQMVEWLAALQHIKMEDNEDWLNEPTSVLEKAAVFELQQLWNTVGRLSPLPRPIKKFAMRYRSPTGSASAPKARRASHTDELPKSVAAWRGRVVHGLKKFNTAPAKGSRSGLRLEEYQSSQNNQFVPLVVELCTSIVEARGLDTVGIYRVPGNNAAVSMLMDAVNQQSITSDLQDARWNDVNVVSSLLKAFFRKLSEPLFTSTLYPQFIAASKLENPVLKLQTIHRLIHLLPRHNFETLKFVMNHLKKVTTHASLNKMEARNLAIVFGPTLVRSADNNMVAMVTDMSHQCCITETIITNAEWLFTKSPTDDLASLPENCIKRLSEPLPVADSGALLENIHKMDVGTFAVIKNLPPPDQRRKSLDYHSRESVTQKQTMSQSMFVPSSHEKSLKPPQPQPDLSPSLSTSDDCSSLTSLSSLSTNKPISDGQRDSESHTETRVKSKEKGKLWEGISDEVVFHTYEELSALTKERIKSFEQETRALLQRDLYRQQEKSSHHQVAREQIEREWQRAKQEMEQDDLLDRIADDPSSLADLYSDRKHQDQRRGINSHCDSTTEIVTMMSGKKPKMMDSSLPLADPSQSKSKRLPWARSERVTVPGQGGLVSQYSNMFAGNVLSHNKHQNHPQMKKCASTDGSCVKTSSVITDDQKKLTSTVKQIPCCESREKLEPRALFDNFLPESVSKQGTTFITTGHRTSSGISASVSSLGTLVTTGVGSSSVSSIEPANVIDSQGVTFLMTGHKFSSNSSSDANRVESQESVSVTTGPKTPSVQNASEVRSIATKGGTSFVTTGHRTSLDARMEGTIFGHHASSSLARPLHWHADTCIFHRQNFLITATVSPTKHTISTTVSATSLGPDEPHLPGCTCSNVPLSKQPSIHQAKNQSGEELLRPYSPIDPISDHSPHQIVGPKTLYPDYCGRSQSMESTVAHPEISNTVLNSKHSHSGEIMASSQIPSSSGIPTSVQQKSGGIHHSYLSQGSATSGHSRSQLLSCYQRRHTISSSTELGCELPVSAKKMKM